MTFQAGPGDGSPGRGRFDARDHSGVAFLVCGALLVVISLFVPGYVDPHRLVPFAGGGVVCAALAGITLWRGHLSTALAIAITFGTGVVILVSALSLEDWFGGRVVAALLTLPTMFISLFMRWPWLLGQLDAAVRRAHRAATIDPLTGLLNRRGLDEQARRIWARARRDGAAIGVLVADVDHFKQVDDKHGHAVGESTDDPAERLRMLIDAADDRMYEAKRVGRNRVMV